jgi:hypothetical protein
VDALCHSITKSSAETYASIAQKRCHGTKIFFLHFCPSDSKTSGSTGPNMDGIINKIFLGYQPYQMVKNHQCFKDHLCPHHQGYETSMIFNQMTQLIVQENFINVSRHESFRS